MIMSKVSDTTQYIKIFDYLKKVPEAELCDFGTFIVMCEQGRSYTVTIEDEIVAILCMYETNKRVFVAHMHIQNGYRRSKVLLELYKKIVGYSSDKKKKVYTTMDDISTIKNTLIPADVLEGGDVLYRIDTSRSML